LKSGDVERDVSGNVTQFLIDWSQGDPGALENLMPLVYNELRRLARLKLLRLEQNPTIEPTSLVHDAYIRLIDQNRVNWQNRAHFFAIAAETMRRILVDHARSRLRKKRGGGRKQVSLESALVASDLKDFNLLALNDALDRLAAIDEKQARIIELRFFAGLSIEDTATVMKISPRTVKREWAMARAWLYREMKVLSPSGRGRPKGG
jgi:RNA polymerase sigma-70 factor (ECF subfamily)